MRDQSNVWPSLLASIVIATLLFQAANSVDLRVFTPRLLELCVCYWILSSPATVGVFFAFTVGLLISLIEGSFLGSASIGLSIVGFVLLNNIFTIRQLDWVSQTTVIFLLLGISLALHRLILSSLGVPSDGLDYLIAVLVSSALWRPFNAMMDATRFRLSQLL